MGPSPIHSILKIPDMLLLDYMHQVLEGEYTRRLSKWLGGSCPSEITISKADQGNISHKLDSMTLPHDFKKKFRPIEEFRRWKASEKELLFLHVGLPVLKDFLPAEHFYHHSLLVTAIRILCEDEVTDHDIDIADAMLTSYTRLLPTLFDDSECTYNSHSLTHFPEQVRNHGPLILHSTFAFESMLAHLKRLFHGLRGISDQICKKLGVTQHASQHVQRNVQGNDSAVEFAKNLMAPAESKLIQLENGVRFFCPLRQEIPHIGPPVDDFFVDKSQLTTSQHGQVFHGLNYVCRRNSASYLVEFKLHGDEQPSYGEVQYFAKYRNVGYAAINVFRNTGLNICQTGLADPIDLVLREFVSSHVLGCHFIGVQRTAAYEIIQCDQITARAIFVKSDDAGVDGYVSTVLKSYQHD